MDGDRSSPETSKAKKKPPSTLRKNFNARWLITIFFTTLAISMTLSFLSSEALEGVGYAVAFCALGFFILLGIGFDIIGVAVTAAEEKPLNSMAARRVNGAKEALSLVRSADRVSSFCNDVVGDICGIISGSTGAVIAARLVQNFSVSSVLITLLVSGIVSALTVGGKAIGKTFAINFSTQIVHFAGRVIFFFKNIFSFGWLKRGK